MLPSAAPAAMPRRSPSPWLVGGLPGRGHGPAQESSHQGGIAFETTSGHDHLTLEDLAVGLDADDRVVAGNQPGGAHAGVERGAKAFGGLAHRCAYPHAFRDDAFALAARDLVGVDAGLDLAPVRGQGAIRVGAHARDHLGPDGD